MDDLARCAARTSRPHRHKKGLRPRPMRGVYDTGRVMTDGANVPTIEGLEKDGALHPLQQAFIDHDAFQCGYCTPGQICSAVGLIAEGKAKGADEIRELMSGNICRCAAYPN